MSEGFRVVWKFAINGGGAIEVLLPRGAKVLSVHEQHGQAQLWALCDPNETILEPRKFLVLGTGHGRPQSEVEEARFVGALHLGGGRFVFHVFEAAAVEAVRRAGEGK